MMDAAALALAFVAGGLSTCWSLNAAILYRRATGNPE